MSCLYFTTAHAQYSAYGFIGGMTLGTQKWNGFDRDPLLTWNSRVFYESIVTDKFSAVVELGLHNRGSGVLSTYIIQGQPGLNTNYSKMVLRNASLMGGAKQIYDLKENMDAFVKLGVRLEYTITENFEIFEQYTEAIQPFNYGITLGGGFHFGPKDSRLQFILDGQVSPDFSQQLFAPQANIWNRFTQQYQTFPEQKVSNLSFEISLGVRWLN